MSQAGIINASASPPPPAVPTTFVTDVNSPAIPALNILNVPAADTITNNANGIRTDGSSGGNTLTVQLTNRISVSTTTSDGAGQTQVVPVLTTTNGTAVIFRAYIIGFDSPNNVATGTETIGVSRTAGGVVTVLGTNDVFLEEDASLAATAYDVTGATNVLSITFTGIAGRTINWTSVFEYVQAP